MSIRWAVFFAWLLTIVVLIVAPLGFFTVPALAGETVVVMVAPGDCARAIPVAPRAVAAAAAAIRVFRTLLLLWKSRRAASRRPESNLNTRGGPRLRC